MDNPLVLIGLIAAVTYVFVLWRKDAQATEPNPAALPGASSASSKAIAIAVIGSLAILGVEIAGEYQLGIVSEQTDITWLFALYMLFAAFGEELVFRGFVVLDKKGKGLLIASCVAGSIGFAALHGHWYENDDEGFRVLTDTKALFSTGMLFLGSLWFYYARFASWNPNRSLIPCVAAHAAKNLGVIVAKFLQGHVVGLY